MFVFLHQAALKPGRTESVLPGVENTHLAGDDMSHIEELRDVIRNFHHAKATHVESVPVTESFQGEVVWDGIVEVFGIKGHPMADRVYAWIQATDDWTNPRHHVTVLHVPPVTSPQAAVQAVIAREYKKRAGG